MTKRKKKKNGRKKEDGNDRILRRDKDGCMGEPVACENFSKIPITNALVTNKPTRSVHLSHKAKY